MPGAPRPSRAPLVFGLLTVFSPLLLLVVLALACVCDSLATREDPLPREEAASLSPGALPRIDPAAPAAALLPRPPEASHAPVYLGDDLACVPELMLESTDATTPAEWKARKAHATAAALHLGGREQDGFLKAVLAARADLAGLPFAMGDACRTSPEGARAFKQAAEAVRRVRGAALRTAVPGPGEEQRQQFYRAHLAVLTQVLPAEDPAGQRALTRAVSSIPRTEATRELARLAVFSTEESVRAAALEALAGRREEDSTDVLAAGLRHPWPPVAENAATAIVKLKRKDLAPQLEALLEAPDPRGPRTEVVAGREQTVAHELVRVNHLRNCLLCHAPAERGKAPEEVLVGEVPVPTEPLPDSRAGYGGGRESEPNLLVRVDVTYLRQDFSAMQFVGSLGTGRPGSGSTSWCAGGC